MDNKTAKELIIHYLFGGASPGVDLRDMLLNELECHEYDGLCNIDEPCGCGLDDLAPCDTIDMHNCVGAYEWECDDCSGICYKIEKPKDKTDE